MGLFLAAFLQVSAQDSPKKVPAGAAIPASFPWKAFDVLPKTPKASTAGTGPATVKSSRTDPNLVWVDSQVVWEEIRNVFAPQSTTLLKRQQQISTSQVDSATRFPTITGIISNKNGKNRAILDGMVVQPGDRLKEFLIKQISKDRVTLQGEETYALELKPHQIPAIKIFLIPAPGKGDQEIALSTASETAVQNEGKEKKPNVKP